MLRKLCLAASWIVLLSLPHPVSAITGNSCSVTVNGSVNTPVSVFTSCSTISVFINPNINFVSGTPMPTGMLITKSSSSGGNATWQISGTPTTSGTGTGVYSFTDSNPGAVTMTINFNIAAPVVPTASFVASTVGQPYPATSVSATGGTGSGYTYSVSAGSLPTGLSLGSNGAITGTTSAAGTFNFTIQATDSGSTSGTASFSILVNPAVSMSASASLARTVGQTYSGTYTASGGTAPVTYAVTAGTLPPGAVLNTGTGSLSGTVSGPASANFTVTATDARGSSAATVVNYVVSPAPMIALATPGGVIGSAYSQAIGFTGAISTASLNAGALPPGLSLTSGGTVVSGTPTTAGTYNFTLAATDSNGVATSASFTIGVTASLTISTLSLPNGVYATAYGATVSASGGIAPLAFSITAGALPAGLNLTSGGVIGGTPSAPGLANFTITVTDAASNTVSRPLSIQITAPPIVISTTSLPPGTQGTAYSANILATGGAGPLNYAVTAGALPSQLTLGATGAITGTPNVIAVSNFTVTVTDAFSASASVALSIGVTSPPIQFTTGALPAGNLGVAYTASIQATGGSGGLTFSLSSGVLPAGLVLGPGGVISGSPSAAGTTSFTVTATDVFSNTASRNYSLSIISPLTIPTNPWLRDTTVGVFVQYPFQAVGGSGPLTWSVSGAVPPGLVMLNGALSGVPSLAGVYSFLVNASDGNGAATAILVSLRVNATLVLTTTSLGGPFSRNGILNVTLLSTGGTAPLDWTTTAGALPPGILLIRDTGRLVGMFQATGTHAFTVRAIDAAGATVSRAFSIVITNGPQFGNDTLPAATANYPYRMTLEAFSVLPIVDWQLASRPESLPPGLRIVDREIAGTPTMAGSYEFEINIRDQGGSSAVQNFKLVVNPPLEMAELKSPVEFTRGKAFNWLAPRRGGTSPFRFQLLNGTFPEGLSLNPTSGEVSGTPTSSGDYGFTIGVTDVNNATSYRLYRFQSGAGFQIRPESLPTLLQLSRDVRFTIALDGGIPPYRLQISSGVLPPGMALTGLNLEGKPTRTGTYPVTLLATDSSGATASRSVSIVVTDGIEVQPRSLSFVVLSGTPFAASHTLKWLSAPGSGPVRITSAAPWLRVQSPGLAVPGFAEVLVEPSLLPEGLSNTELVLQSGGTISRVPVQVEKFPSDPGAWWVDVAPSPGGGWAALVQGAAARIPFSAKLDAAGAARYLLSESRGEIAGPDSYLLWIERRREPSSNDVEFQLEVENLMTGEEQNLLLPDEALPDIELSASSVLLLAEQNAPRSNASIVVARATNRRPLRVAALSDQPWLQVEVEGAPSSPDVLLKFRALAASLPEGSYQATVQLYNQAGLVFASLPVDIEVGPAPVPVEISALSLSLNKAKPRDSIRLFNPGSKPISFSAKASSAALRLDNPQGEIPPGGEVRLTIQASESALNSWNRQQVLVSLGGVTLEIVEVDLGLAVGATGCPSPTPVLSFLTPGAGFAAQVDMPMGIRIAVRNGCGEPMFGSVMSLKIPGESPIALYPGPEGIWHGTWTPTRPAPSLQLEAIWLDAANRRAVSRYWSGSVAP